MRAAGRSLAGNGIAGAGVFPGEHTGGTPMVFASDVESLRGTLHARWDGSSRWAS